MNYDWTPISEPPEHTDDVAVWVDLDQGYWIQAIYECDCWISGESGVTLHPIKNHLTHWKDIEAPKV